MKLTSSDYLGLEWNIANSNRVETVNTSVDYKVPVVATKGGAGTPGTTQTLVYSSSGYFKYPYSAYPDAYNCLFTTNYYTSTGSITITFDQPISGTPIIKFVTAGLKYKSMSNSANLLPSAVVGNLLTYMMSLTSGISLGYDLRDKITPNDMSYTQTDTTTETKINKGTISYHTTDVTQRRLNTLGTPVKNDYYVDLDYHRWNYDGANWIDEGDGVFPVSLIRFWNSFTSLGTIFIIEGGLQLNKYVDQHTKSEYGYGLEYSTTGYKAGNRPLIDESCYTYTLIGSKSIKIDFNLVTHALLWVTTSEGASRNYMRVWYNETITLEVQMQNTVIEYSFSLDSLGNLTHVATNKYPLTLDTSNLVDENTLVNTTEWDHAVAKEVLDAFKGGRYAASAKVSVYWVRDNLVTIGSVTQVVLLNGKYISRGGVVCNFKVTNIEGVFEQGQFYYNIALLEE